MFAADSLTRESAAEEYFNQRMNPARHRKPVSSIITINEVRKIIMRQGPKRPYLFYTFQTVFIVLQESHFCGLMGGVRISNS